MVENQPEEKINLHIHDLTNCLNIIDTAAQRGAFRGNELSAVGAVRDKLALFLEQTVPQESADVESEEPSSAKTDEVVTENKAPTKSPAPKTSRTPKKKTTQKSKS